MDGYVNRRQAGQRFVDRVVDDLIDEMMQAHLAGRPNVHGGTLAHGFHARRGL